MKVIIIGNDPKLFETGSAVSRRQVVYGGLFEEVHIFSRGGAVPRRLSQNVFVHPLNLGNVFKTLSGGQFVVSTQDPFEHGLIGVLCKLCYGVSLHVQIHTDFRNKYFLFSSALNFVRFFLAHLVLPYADGVRVVSARVKENVKELNGYVEILPIRVDTENGKKALKTPFSVLTVARLEKEKDLETAIEAFALASKKYPEAVFTIVGDGSQRKSLEVLAKNVEVGDRVKFVGWQNDLEKFYDEADIYISTSLFEGYGMSIVEAAEAGCALVLSDAGVATEFTAFVSKPKDVKNFARSLEKFLGDPGLSRQMGERARLETEKFKMTNEIYLAKYAKNMESVWGAHVSKRFLDRVGDFVAKLFKRNKILRFLFGGATAALTQIFSLYLLTDVFGVWYLYSSIFSFCIAFIVSFSLQKFWVFQNMEVKGAHIQFFKYIVVVCLGIAINTLIMYALVTVIGLWYILAQIISGMIIAVFNFVSYKKFIFKDKQSI